jgi:hypothetical protein
VAGSFCIDPQSSSAQIKANSTVRRARPHEVYAFRMTPKNSFGSRNGVLRQIKTCGKIIPSACWQNPQDNVSAASSIH